MLRINVIASPQAAEQYYLQSADYYLDQDAIPARWHGKGAELLGLHGEVGRDHFTALCRNKHPLTAERLTASMRTTRRSGYDFTFTASKSISILQALAGDDRILTAFRHSVNETMQIIEQDAAARVRKRGLDEDRSTGNLVWSDFVHTLSRPTGDAGTPQPALHCHVVVQNATFDHEEGIWKALQAGGLKSSAPYYQAIFRAKLAEHMQLLGYELDIGRDDFEIRGVPATAVRKLSKRTEEIEALARKLNIKSPAVKATLGRRSRQAKTRNYSWDQLKDKWHAALTSEEIKAVHTAFEASYTSTPQLRDECGPAFDLAIDHLLERQSAVPQQTLLAEALRRGLGRVTLDGLRKELDRPELRRGVYDGQPMVTTRTVMDEEKELVALVRQGRGAQQPLGVALGAGTEHLNAGQRGAVTHLLTSRNLVTCIRGVAGSGKSTLLKAARQEFERAGCAVTVLAPTAAASRLSLREGGITDADTLQRFLVDQEMQRRAAGQAIFLDEASLVGVRDMLALASLADKHQFRIAVFGDRRQHKSVARGHVLAVLEDFGGVKAVEVTEILRQKGDAKEVVALLARGKAEEALDRLEKDGAISTEGYDALANEYVDAMHRGQSVLAVSPTHEEAAIATSAIRARLGTAGVIHGEERVLTRLVDLQTTEADRRDPSRLGPGLIAQFLHPKGPFKNGERVIISAANKDILRQHASSFQLYQEETLSLTAGDRIRCTKGGKSVCGHRLDNGATFVVQGFDGNDIVLSNQWRITGQFGHINHDWVVTSFAAQSRTVDTVLIAQGAQSLPATNSAQFYVAASRARSRIRVFTDSPDELRRAVARPDDKAIALLLANGVSPVATAIAKLKEAHSLVRRHTLAAALRIRHRGQLPKRKEISR